MMESAIVEGKSNRHAPQNNQKIFVFCPLEGIIDVISKKWALLIINVLGHNGKLMI